MPNISFNGALNKVYQRQKPNPKDFEDFCNQLENLKRRIEKGITLNESEDNFKTFINSFLSDSYYKETNLINTKNKIDSAIYKTKESDSPVQVLIEAKRPGSNEFPKEKNLNSKAMQEALLYFLRERILWKNIDLKHIIITNGFEWFLFDAHEFEANFYNDKKLRERYEEFDIKKTLCSGKTEFFYNEIASPAIENIKEDINYTYFNIKKLTEKQKVNVFKLLSPEHLLRKFSGNDSNELNTPFYNELLYILGLEEVEIDNNIQIRRLENNRQSASFIENTICQIEDDVPNEEKQFDIALSLTITWINRILFLKLLETQLINYHNGNRDYCFLNIDKINGFDDLQQLFFKVLAVPVNERKPANVAEKYHNVPYLNSSLFETTENESKFCKVSSLRDDKLTIYKRTVLRNNHNNKRLDGEMPVLEYLFRFLDAYDFGSEANDESITSENSTRLINASVLGLIFEKINGYKDGSYFTPAYVTQYICQETLRRTVVQMFNETNGWNCKTLKDVKNQCREEKISIEDKNRIINSLRICDPAVGSGHFLVSALNELISIKDELGALSYNGELLDGNLTVKNDELLVTFDDGKKFTYNPQLEKSQKIQEMLFNEKRTIIENCLFGVDINPNSVNICQLRLWIELLKNAYYKDNGDLETLPNIDINIKCGDSLISKYPIRIGQIITNDDIKDVIKEYKQAVIDYKKESNKPRKKDVERLILTIKTKLFSGIQFDLFDDSKREKAIAESFYRNSMEWMIEFPEVLDENGNFLGFDAIIGNPPYGTDIDALVDTLNIKYPETSEGYKDIYKYFFDRSLSLLKKNGYLSFITPNTFFRQPRYGDLRRLMLKNNICMLLDIGDVFEEAVVIVAVSLIKNEIAHFRLARHQ